jgi:hypothetical protein
MTPPTNPHPNPPPQPATETPEKPIVTATRETVRPQIPEPKPTATPKRAPGESKKKAAASIKTAAATPQHPASPKSNITTRGNLRSPRSLPPHACVELTRSSAPHVHLFPPYRGSSPSRCPEDRNSFCSRIWQHAVGGQSCVKPCASPAGMRTEFAAGSLNLSTFSASTVSIFVSELRPT